MHSDQENEFVFNLIKDKKFGFKWDSSYNYVMNGPFIGAFQPYGEWRWVTGEKWTYTHWCKDGVKEEVFSLWEYLLHQVFRCSPKDILREILKNRSPALLNEFHKTGQL